MLIFCTGFFILLSLQAALQIFRRLLSDRMLIDEKEIANFDFESFAIAYDLLSRYNNKTGDPEVKTNLMNSIYNVTAYFNKTDRTKNYQIIKAFPLIIEMLGRDFENDTRSVWYSTGIFFKIIHEVSKLENKVKLMPDEMVTKIFQEFYKRCKGHCKRGIADGAFISVFSDIKSSLENLNIFLKFVPTSSERAEIFALYIASMNLETLTPNFLFEFLKRSSNFDYRAIFQLAASFMAKNALSLKNCIDQREAFCSVNNYLSFLQKNQLASKTEYLILQTVLLKLEK